MNFKTNFLKCIFIVSLSLTTLFAKAQAPGPIKTVLCAGETRTLTSTVTGAKYQWFKDGALILETTSRTYEAVGAADPGAAYTVVAINAEGCASDASDPIYVVNAPVATPVITISNNSSCQTATNEVVLTGSGVPTLGIPTGLTYAFEWKKEGTVVGTGTTLTLKNVVESGNYTLTLTPVWKTKKLSCAATTPTPTTVTIYPFAAKATISTVISGYQTADEERAGMVCEFNTVTLTASVSSTDANITTSVTYQWYRNNTALSGETAATLVLTNVGSTNSGNYTVKTKTANNCEATSDASVVDVIARSDKPTIQFED